MATLLRQLRQLSQILKTPNHRMNRNLRPHSARALVENLETRVLLSAFAVTAGAGQAAEASSVAQTFVITRTGGTTGSVSINLAYTGTATSVSDYAAPATTVVFADGDASKTITITPVDDNLYEGNETVIATITDVGAGNTIGGSPATITIADNDKPTISISAPTATPTEGGTPGKFTITRTGATGAPSVVVKFTRSGTATAGTDYTTFPLTLTIPSGSTSADISVASIDDSLLEGDETVILTLTNDTAYTADTNARTATVTIKDDEVPTVSVVATDNSAAEGSTTDKGLFTFTRNGPTTSSLVVSYTMTGTATNGVDYTALTSPVTIPAGAASVTLTLASIADTTLELNETAILSIDDALGYDVDADKGSATITIVDDEKPVISVAATDATANEIGVNNTGTFTITRTGPTTVDQAVTYTISGTAKTGDFVALSGTATIPVGSSSVDVEVTPIDNQVIDGSRTIIMTLSTGTAYTLDTDATKRTATINLTDNELPYVSVTAADATATDGSTTDKGKFTISRTTATADAVTVKYTVTGTAEAGTDYTALTGTAIIPANATSVDVVVAPLANSAITLQSTVTLNLTADSAYQRDNLKKTATVTIYDKDKPSVSISATDASAAEASSATGTFRITRTGPKDILPLTVYYTVSGVAINGTDYALITGNVTLDVGEQYEDITITPTDDNLVEGAETVVLTLTPVTTTSLYTLDAVAANNTATVTIADNDKPTVSIAAVDAVATENVATDTAKFTITRNGPTTQEDLTVKYAVSGTATAGVDYVLLTGTAVIKKGTNSVDVVVTPVNNTTLNLYTTVILTLSSDSAYLIDSNNHDGAIKIMDDEKPVVSVIASDSECYEGSSYPAYFTIFRSGPKDLLPLTVTYTITGTAASGTDYAKPTGTVTFAVGESSKVVAITPIDDTLIEGDETVILTLSAGTTYTLDTAKKTDTMTIIDNDLTTVSVYATTDTVTEGVAGAKGVFTFTRTGETTQGAMDVYFEIDDWEYAAVPGVDYTALPDHVTFPAGALTTTLNVVPLRNTATTIFTNVDLWLDYGDVDYNISDGRYFARVTIKDADKPKVTIAASDADAGEGITANKGTFTFTRSGPNDRSDLTATYTISGTASPGDYTLSTYEVYFDYGESTATVNVTPVNDSVAEGNETVVLTVAPGVDYSLDTDIAKKAATVTIADNDKPTVSVVATTPTVAENVVGAKGVFTFTRTGETTQGAMTVNYTIDSSSTAVPGTDYTAITGTVVIPAGLLSATVNVTPLYNTALTLYRNVNITLATDAAYTIDDAKKSGSVKITDYNKPVVTIAAGVNGSEAGTSAATFVFTRTGPTDLLPLTVNYTISGTAVNGTDYTTITNSVTLEVGEASHTLSITPIDDSLAEGIENVTLTLAVGTDYTITTDSAKKLATDNITDNDNFHISIVAADALATEGSTTDLGKFTVSRDGTTLNPITVNLAITGTATNTTDYTTIANTVTIPAGKTSVDIVVTPKAKNNIYTGSETVILTVATGSGYIAGDAAAATVKILDADLPTVSVLATDAAASEVSNDTGTFTISRAGPTTDPVTVNFSLVGTAYNGTDYVLVSGPVTIPAGQASATVTITPVTDSTLEGPETAILVLTTDATYKIDSTKASATVTIADAQLPAVSVNAIDNSAAELGSDKGTFRIWRTGPTAAASLTVNFALSGTATVTTDYAVTSGGQPVTNSVTIPAGLSYVDINVTPVNDNLTEGNETIVLTLSANAGVYTVSGGAATVTITDKPVAQLSVEGNSVAISNNDSTPSTDDNTDFGSADANSKTVTITYTIKNLGDATLTISDIGIGGTNFDQFTVSNISGTSVDGIATFDVTFTPTSTGTKTASVIILSDDPTNPVFTFDITGKGT